MITELVLSTGLAIGGAITPGSSEAAKYVAASIWNQRSYFHQPYTRGEPLRVAQENLVSTFERCSEANWDGYGAEPVTQDSYRNAYLLLEALPAGYPMPVASAEPDGQLTLEWYRSPMHTLSVSVSATGELHYAALIGPAKAYGTEFLFGCLPKALSDILGRIYSV
jgi:hypothetical protein